MMIALLSSVLHTADHCHLAAWYPVQKKQLVCFDVLNDWAALCQPKEVRHEARAPLVPHVLHGSGYSCLGIAHMLNH